MGIRSKLRSVVLDILGWRAKPAPGVHIITGHMLTRGTATEVDVRKFEKLLVELSKDVKFIRFEEAVEKISMGGGMNNNEPLVAFSFDDGFAECLQIASVLEKFGTNACFFINPNFVEGDEEYIRNFTESTVLTHGKRPLRHEDLQKLISRGHIIGAHTMDHYMIVGDDKAALDYQIKDCKSAVERLTGTECKYFAFPYGRLEHADNTSIDIACNAYPYVFSQSDYKHYKSFGGRVINRRHFEPFWKINHVRYFISCNKK